MTNCNICGKKRLSYNEYKEVEEFEAADRKFDGGEWSGSLQDEAREKTYCTEHWGPFEAFRAELDSPISTIELSKRHPKAFAALPIPYQNDSCLDFYENAASLGGQYGLPDDDFVTEIIALPAEGQEFALGEWAAVFNSMTNKWVEL